ncbi:MAG: hypothetical protein KBC64_07495 [Simkaniaceae bacterium]|nr:hypothetical protein [Simkaniaceae bacterium]
MNIKKTVGGIIFILGIVMAIYAIHSMGRISQAKGSINNLTGPFSDRQEGQFANKVLSHEASKYDTDVMILLVTGIIFIVIGGSVALISKKKRN